MAETQATHMDDDIARLRVLDAIKSDPGALTVGDVVARTGMAPFEAERQLNVLVREYQSELDVDASGNLVYRFDPELTARPDIIKADRWRRRKEAIAKAFIAFFKTWTVVMIVAYAVIYVLLFIAFLVASSSQGGDRRGSRRGSLLGGGRGGGLSPFDWFMLWTWQSNSQDRRIRREYERRVHQGYDPYDLSARPAPPQKPSVVQRTWYFLFGARSIEGNPLAQEKELLTYIRAKKGIIANADIVALLGVTYDEADKIGTRLVATYNGELDLTDNGLAIYRFPELMVSTHKFIEKQVARMEYLWESRRKLHQLKKNPAILIPVLNGVNLFFAFFSFTTMLPALDKYLAVKEFGRQAVAMGERIHFFTSPVGIFLLVIFPGIFSICFYAVAGVRILRDAKDRGRYERDNIRISIYRLLFQRQRPVVVPGDEELIADAGLGGWSQKTLEKHAPRIAEDLRGEVAQRADGRWEIRAPRVWAELRAVTAARRKAGSGQQPLGRTVFSSAGELQTGTAAEEDLSGEITTLGSNSAGGQAAIEAKTPGAELDASAVRKPVAEPRE